MERVQPGDIIVSYNISRIVRHFEERVVIQVDLTTRGIWIGTIQDSITTADENAGARFYRRMMLANGAFHSETTGEQIHTGLKRARKKRMRLGCPPALAPEREQEPRNIYARTRSIRATAREMNVSQGTVNKTLELDAGPVGGMG